MTPTGPKSSQTSGEKPSFFTSLLQGGILAGLGFKEQIAQMLEEDSAIMKRLEVSIGKDVRRLKSEKTLKDIFSHADALLKVHNRHSQENIDQAKKVLTEIYVGALYLYAEEAKKEGVEKMYGAFLEKMQKSRVLRAIISSDFPNDEDKRELFGQVSNKSIDTKKFKKSLLTERFFMKTAQALNEQVIGFVFLGALKFKEFLPDKTQKKLEDFHKKYGSQSPDGVLQLSLWNDTISLLHDLKGKDSNGFCEKIMKCFFIYQKIFAYFLHLKKIAHNNGTVQVVYQQEQAETILGLIFYALELFESIKEEDIALFLNEAFNPYVFFETPKNGQMAAFYKSPMSTEVFSSHLPTQHKRLVASIIATGKDFFIQDPMCDDAQQSFRLLLNPTITQHQLEEVLLYFKKHKSIPTTSYKTAIAFILSTPEYEKSLTSNHILKEQQKLRLQFLHSSHSLYTTIRQGFDTLNIFQSQESFQKEVDELLGKETDNNIDEIIEDNKVFVFQKGFSNPDGILNTAYILTQGIERHLRKKLLWDIFSFRNSSSEIEFLLRIFGKIQSDLPHFQIARFIGEIGHFLSVCRAHKIDENSIFDDDMMEIIFVYLGESETSVDVDGIMGSTESFLGYKQKDIITAFGEQIGEKLYTFLTEYNASGEMFALVARIGKMLNGYNQEFAFWFMDQSSISVSALENIASFFHFLFSLSAKKITHFNDIGKIFRFLTPIESQECKRRISILYERFVASGKIGEAEFEGFKNTVLRYMKNGDISIIDIFLTPEFPPEASDIEAGLEGISGKVIAIPFPEVARKLGALGYTEKEKRASGGHRHFHKEGKKISIPHHPGDIGLIVIRETIKGLGITPRYWNSL